MTNKLDIAAQNAIIRRNFELFNAVMATNDYRAAYYWEYGHSSESRWRLYFAVQTMWHRLARDPQTGEWNER